MSKLHIRPAEERDFNSIMRLYADARVFMRENGNPDQWGNFHPPEDMIQRDIHEGTGFICEDETGTLCGAFAFFTGIDPTYIEIFDGQWLNEEPYGVVHRIATTHDKRGVGEFCLNWAFQRCGNLRIDTHRNNKPMQNLLAKLGFRYCGIIETQRHGKCIAYQKCAANIPNTEL